MISSKRGFTLIELLVVISMIVIIMGALTVSVQGARARARIQKATAEVKIISQAILAYENYASGHQLQTMTRADADASNLGFLLGKGNTSGDQGQQGGKLPVLLQAALTSGGKMLDPWGHPYKVTIKEGTAQFKLKTVTGTLQTGYYLPNFYRISEGER